MTSKVLSDPSLILTLYQEQGEAVASSDRDRVRDLAGGFDTRTSHNSERGGGRGRYGIRGGGGDGAGGRGNGGGGSRVEEGGRYHVEDGGRYHVEDGTILEREREYLLVLSLINFNNLHTVC